MKKYSLAISLPQHRTLSQDAALDDLLSDKRAVSYSRTIEKMKNGSVLSENFVVNYILTVV